MMERKHRHLPVWQAALGLVEAFYAASRELPDEERYGLQSQMRRAAVSVAANIAEGSARQTRQELLQFLYIANGSLSELDTHLEISRRLGYIDGVSSLQSQLDDVQRQLLAVIHSLKRRSR